MPPLTPAQALELRRLRASFLARLPTQVQALQETADRLFLGRERPRHVLERLLHQVHRLCGSSAIFGFKGVSRAAQGLENAVRDALEDVALPGPDAALRTIRGLGALKSALLEDEAEESRSDDASSGGRQGLDSPRRARVLLVDDDEDTLDLVALHLRNAGAEVTTAENGNQALERVRHCHPDVVVADVKMNGMSGYELCRLLREIGFADLPIVLCSALATSGDRVAGLRMGADDFLGKPFDPDELVLKVQRWALRRPLDPTATEEPRPTASPRRRQVLVVDDDLRAAMALRPHLLEQGYAVRIATSGNEALDYLRGETADLVVLDVMMPILSGLDVCRWMRTVPALRRTPVIFLTARKHPKDMLAGQAAGADLYVLKPVAPRRLVNMVDMFLSRDIPLARQAGPAQPDST